MIYSDAARRAADVIALHISAHGSDAFGKWVALRLTDGGSDGVMYERKGEAIRYQLHEHQCAYAQIIPGGMPPEDAEVFLAVHRRLYEQGARITDPDRDLFIPSTFAERVISRLRRNGVPR